MYNNNQFNKEKEMKEELDRIMSIIKDYKSGYGGVTDGFMRSELEIFTKDYADEQVKKALEPNDKNISNYCSSYRHDFGLMNSEDKKNLEFECKEWLRAISNNQTKKS